MEESATYWLLYAFFRFVPAFKLLIAFRSHSLVNFFWLCLLQIFFFIGFSKSLSSLSFSDIHKYLINFSSSLGS